MPESHVFVFNVGGARDLLRRNGLRGAVEDHAWQNQMAVALIADAAALLRDYGYVVEEPSAGDTPVWAFARGGKRASDFTIGVDRDGDIVGWIPDDAAWSNDDREEPTRKLTAIRPTGIVFDHVTREVLGAELTRGDGHPIRKLDSDAGPSRRYSPLETLLSFILTNVR